MRYLLTVIALLFSLFSFSQTYQEGKAAYDAGEYEKAFSILEKVQKGQPDFNKATRLKNQTQQKLLEKANKALQSKKDSLERIKSTGNIQAPKVIQTRYLTDDEIAKKQKQLKASASRLTFFSLLGAGTGLAAVVVDPEKSTGLAIASGLFGIATAIETIVFVNKSAALTAGIKPGMIQVQIKF